MKSANNSKALALSNHAVSGNGASHGANVTQSNNGKHMVAPSHKTHSSRARTRQKLWHDQFLDALRKTISVTAAARVAGVGRKTC